MSEPPHKPVRRRRPTLAAALKAAQKAGRTVRTAVVEPDGKVTLTFGDDTSVESGTNEWDEALKRCGKN
jgi:uncharacterized protein GlcG (DUF336 family)